MKIGLDGQNLLVEKKAGPEMYTYRLYKAMCKPGLHPKPGLEFLVYLTKEPNQETVSSIMAAF